MAYSTVIPKENPARNNKHTVTTLERRDGELVGPELSWTIDWHPQTKVWWDTWRKHEIAPMLEETDWDFLMDTALIHHNIWNNPKLSVAQMTAGLAELRQRVAKFGGTFEDRLKLRIKFADATIKEDKANPIVKVKNYKALLEDDEDDS